MENFWLGEIFESIISVDLGDNLLRRFLVCIDIPLNDPILNVELILYRNLNACFFIVSNVVFDVA